MEKNLPPGSEIRMFIPNHISESLVTIFWIPSGTFLTLDPDEKTGSGIKKKTRIRSNTTWHPSSPVQDSGE
jgi:hypothetical protein